MNENFIDEVNFKKNDLVYDLGSPAEVFFIIKEGSLVLETLIRTETHIKHPVE